MDKEFKGLFDQSDESEGDDGIPDRSGVSVFMQHFGWIYQATLVAEHERITLEQAFEIKTINFLNDLVYLKSKSDYEKEIMKKAYGKIH